MFELTPTVRARIEGALGLHGPKFAQCSDGAYVVRLDERDALYLLVFPAPGGSERAAAAAAQHDASRTRHPRIGVATVLMNLSELAAEETGVLLILGPRGDRCATLASLPDAEQRRMLAAVREHPPFADVEVEDIWVNTTLPDAPTPFLIRANRIRA